MLEPGFEGFLELPLEVLSIILEGLGAKDLLSCGETCRDLHTIVKTVPALQYILALGAYGLVDNEFSHKPVTEKLERARLTYRAYRDFNWIPHFIIQLDGLRLERPSSPLVLNEPTNTTVLTFLIPGSIVRDASERYWTVRPQPATAFSRSFNVSEDLLVLQTQDNPNPRFHLRTMSDGGVHPEAALHSLASTMLGIEHLTYGPYILLQGVNGVHALWNWKSGVMLTSIRCHYTAIAFLDLDHLGLVRMTNAGQSIHVYNSPFIIFDVDAGNTNPPQYALGLPTLAPEVAPLACSMTRGPATSHVSRGSAARAGDFYTDPEEVLLTVNYEQVFPRMQYALIIRLRSLLALLTPEHLNQNTLWEEWGPTRAHAFPLPRRHLTSWDRHSIFGMRRIDTYPTLRGDGMLVATIYDYHGKRVALAREEIPAADSRWVIVDGGNAPGIWLGMDELETLLPFVKITVPLPAELQLQRDSATILSLNDDGIIASTDFQGSNPRTVHVYTI